MSRHPLLHFLHAAAPGDGVPDAELARRYAADRDEAAFELLVRRHADAVWAACRTVLPRDHQAAEDAFQATFLALARKAGGLRTPCVAGWLYRVAVNAALKARSRAAVLPAADRPAAAADPDGGEAGALLHEELARLDDRFRLPVLLCDLAGLTHAQAAARLGWPVGTVSGRLSEARARLRVLLARRGVAPAAALAAVLGCGTPAPAGLVRTALILVGGAAVPPQVLSLTEGVLFAMRLTKLKLTAVAFAAIALAGATTLTATSQDRPLPPGAAAPPATVADAKVDPAWNGAAPPSAFPDIKPAGNPGVAGKVWGHVAPSAGPDAKPAGPLGVAGKVWGHVDPSAGPDAKPGGARPPVARVTVLATDTPLRKLQKARLNLLVDDFHAAEATARAGQISAADVRQHAAGLAAAAADVFDRPDDLRPWLEAWVAAAKADETAAEGKSRQNVISAADLRAARLARIQAEIALAKLPAK